MSKPLTVPHVESLSSVLSLSIADKLFGKRLLQAGRHIMSHKSWMKTVPTENCDVLMTFAGQSVKHSPTHVFLKSTVDRVHSFPILSAL